MRDVLCAARGRRIAFLFPVSSRARFTGFVNCSRFSVFHLWTLLVARRLGLGPGLAARPALVVGPVPVTPLRRYV